MLIHSYPLVLFGCTIVFFHASEICLVLFIEPEEWTCKSALLSPAYLFAMCCGIAEYLTRPFLFPQLFTSSSSSPLCVIIGIGMIIIGETLRKAAWFTARASFTHLIQHERRSKHQLVTTGIYSIVRHPGYLGWMIWAVGTQVLLSNILCSIAFSVVIWRFFHERIPIEEIYLLRMFGNDYRQYRKRVPTRIPGIP